MGLIKRLKNICGRAVAYNKSGKYTPYKPESGINSGRSACLHRR
jgi:hypothetical protein